jgi:pilus assembly protein Flp/PilA
MSQGGETFMKTLTTYLHSLRSDERGQGLVEYALIIALVSIALIAALGVMAGGIGNVFGDINTALQNAIP